MRRLLTACTVLLLTGRAFADDPVDYVKQVKPILQAKCFACHGALRHQRGLRLDAASLIRKGSERGPVIVPGNAAESLLIRKVSAEDLADRMPPEGEGEPLTAAQIALLRTWIDAGAAAPDEPVPGDPRSHWAYVPPVKPEVPESAGAPWVRNEIDALLAAKHRQQGLQAAAEAPKQVLLRRVYLDLVGLPPTREQLLQFLADESPRAYERVVDELLASPQYGERWARHWMDVWRYSDWAGFGNEIRYSQRHIWRWRDWIVESLNADKGYDRMIVEMLAADELAPGDADAGRATGYLARNWYKFDRNAWLDDVVEHTSKAFLGVTLKCARCHDHKYDPIPQTDFYRFRAVFEPYDVRTDRVPGELDTNEDGLARVYDARPEVVTYLFQRGDPKQPEKERAIAPGVPAVLGGAELSVESVALPLESYYPAMREFVTHDLVAKQRSAVATAAAELINANSALESAVQRTDSRAGDAEPALALAEKQLSAALAKLEALQARVAAEKAKYGVTACSEDEQAALVRSAAKAQRRAASAEAEANLLAARHARDRAQRNLKDGDEQSKKALADAEKQLAAANKALESAQQAAEKEDASYEPLGPSYPKSSTGRRLALARWIADRRNPLTARVAVNHMWLRHFGTPLVENMVDFGLRSPSPLHRDMLDYLAVELIERGWSMKELHRMIVTSGAYRMSSRPGDAPASNVAADPDNQYLWRMNSRRMEAETVRDALLAVAGSLDSTLGGPEIPHAKGLTVPRRSLYFQHARERQMEFLQIFDAPNPRECYRRTSSVLPQQAFAMINSPLALAQSRLLAARLAGDEHGSCDDEQFLLGAFETVLSRDPNEKERDACLAFLRDQTGRLADAAQLELLNETANPVAAAEDPQLRARENLVLVLFNHNDFVTVR